MDKRETHYPIQPIDIRNVKITDSFWLPIIQRVQQKTIAYALQKSKDEGRIENFLIAGGMMEGEVRGAMPFDDTDVYKIIEGASNSIISSPDKQLEVLLDSLIAIIAIGQEEDGYLTTWRTINPAKPPADWVQVKQGKRWESLSTSHELYNAGHLYEAAAVHYKATSKTNFLDIAVKNADLMVTTFGKVKGKIHSVPGHQIIETGLIKLYLITGTRDYLELSKYFLDNRGNQHNHVLFGSYAQDHVPAIQQEEVVGHAVRAVYMYAGMTDIAAIYQDRNYRDAVDKLWRNMVTKKMYITGGIGARPEGESFGENYELPNLTAYNETCAAIGSVYWNNRLFNLTGDTKYNDVIERTLYNGVISGLSQDGSKFFYPNALESDGIYKFNYGSCSRQPWFDCSCCPTNLIRFIPSVPSLIYAKQKDTLYVNQFISNLAQVVLDGQIVHLELQTKYPWEGHIKLTMRQEAEAEFTLKVRIPGWSRNEVLPGGLYHYSVAMKDHPVLSIGGESLSMPAKNSGYFVITRKWSKEEVINIHFPMQTRKVTAI
ncbi:MAG: beta-L-arabinofuranosidase domain-containing protein, partial [Cyclobacteriaceae bacterium]